MLYIPPIIMLWYANINSVLIQFIHNFRLFPFIMYSWKLVVIESIIYTLTRYFMPNIMTPYVLFNDIIYIMSPEIVIICIIILFRICFKSQYNSIVLKYETIFSEMPVNKKYAFGKNFDIFFSLILPIIPIVIILWITLS